MQRCDSKWQNFGRTVAAAKTSWPVTRPSMGHCKELKAQIHDRTPFPAVSNTDINTKGIEIWLGWCPVTVPNLEFWTHAGKAARRSGSGGYGSACAERLASTLAEERGHSRPSYGQKHMEKLCFLSYHEESRLVQRIATGFETQISFKTQHLVDQSMSNLKVVYVEWHLTPLTSLRSILFVCLLKKKNPGLRLKKLLVYRWQGRKGSRDWRIKKAGIPSAAPGLRWGEQRVRADRGQKQEFPGLVRFSYSSSSL